MKIRIFLLFILLSLLTSCASIDRSSILYKPPAFSFVLIDPNNFDEAYAQRMEKYDRILATSPIPVYIIDVDDLAQELKSQAILTIEIVDIKIIDIEFTEYSVYGTYFKNTGTKGWPSEFIFINKNLTPEDIIATYAHEIGHYEHNKNNCECFVKKDFIMIEEHAFLNELRVGLHYNDPEMLETSIRIMGSYTLGNGGNLYYKLAIFNVMKSDLWRTAIAYLILLENGNIK